MATIPKRFGVLLYRCLSRTAAGGLPHEARTHYADSNEPRRGCNRTITHQCLETSCGERDHAYTLILEDDASFHLGFARQLDQAWDEVVAGRDRGDDSIFSMYRISKLGTACQKPFFRPTYSAQCVGSGICPDMFCPDGVLRNSSDYFPAVARNVRQLGPSPLGAYGVRMIGMPSCSRNSIGTRT